MHNKPYMELVSKSEIGEWFLSHAIWHPTNIYGIDIGQPETGVRQKIDDEWCWVGMIQHDRLDFVRIEPLIIRALNKGWDLDRIAAFLRWLRDKQRVKAVIL